MCAGRRRFRTSETAFCVGTRAQDPRTDPLAAFRHDVRIRLISGHSDGVERTSPPRHRVTGAGSTLSNGSSTQHGLDSALQFQLAQPSDSQAALPPCDVASLNHCGIPPVASGEFEYWRSKFALWHCFQCSMQNFWRHAYGDPSRWPGARLQQLPTICARTSSR